MWTALLSILSLALLFVGFGFMNRGKEDARRCGACPSSDALRKAIDELNRDRP